MSRKESTSRLIYRHVAGLEQKIALLESQKSALEDRVTALVEALKEASESLGHMGAEHLKSRVDAALRAAGVVLP